MNHEIRNAFQSIRAEEPLKAHTRARIHEALYKKRSRNRAFSLCAAALCSLLMVLGGYRLYFTPSAIISIDINPSIELSINRFDRVVAVNGYNADGVDFASSLNVLHQRYSQAVDTILSSQTVVDCLARDEFLSIAVVQIDEMQGEEILEYVSTCTAGTKNAHCYGVQQEEVEQAHALGLSYGKYRMYLELQAYSDAYTPEQVNAMTMREIRQCLEQLEQSSGNAEQSMQHKGNPGTGKHGNRYRFSE